MSPENEANLNPKEKSKGCQHCKNKMKNSRDIETETDFSISVENDAASVNDDLSVSELSTHDVSQPELTPTFDNDPSGCEGPICNEFSNIPCWSFYKTCDIQYPYKWPKIPIIPLESLQQTTGR